MSLLNVIREDATRGQSYALEQNEKVSNTAFEGLLQWVQTDCECQNASQEEQLHSILVCYMKLMGEDTVPLWLQKNCQLSKRLPATIKAMVKKARLEVLEDCQLNSRPSKRAKVES